MPNNALATVNPQNEDEEQLPKGEPESRVKIVGKQCKSELDLALDPNGRAVFFVPSPLTPLYINPEAVQFNEQSRLYELKPDYKDAIPEGLIPEEKLKDPEQLSTVLGRVLSLSKLKQNSIIIFYVQDRTYDEGRKKVDDSQLKTYLHEHPNCKLIKISQAEYDKCTTENLPQVIYSYTKDGELIQEIYYSSQINTPPKPITINFKILRGLAAQPGIEKANESLIINNGEKPIPLLQARVQVPGRSGLFTPPPANQATISSTTDTCRSSTTAPSI